MDNILVRNSLINKKESAVRSIVCLVCFLEISVLQKIGRIVFGYSEVLEVRRTIVLDSLL